MTISYLKGMLLTITGAIGSAVINLLGGWTNDLKTLLIFMVIDFITGILVAGVFKKSGKSKTGSLNSDASWKGLCKKGMILLFVLIGAQLDSMIGVTYIRTAVIIAFMVNELISIVENAGLMGVPVPAVVMNAIDVLKNKSESAGADDVTN